MDSILVVVVDVVAKKTSQVPLVDHDHVIQQFTSNGPDPALRSSILPRTSVCGPLGLDSELPDRLDEALREDRVVVVDQKPERVLVWECLSKLLNRPRRGWMRRDVDMPDLSPTVIDDEPP